MGIFFIMEKDYTNIYNKFVTLYAECKNPDIEKKCYDKLWEIIDSTMRYSYYAFVSKNKIFRYDHEDKLADCTLRVMLRIHKWKFKHNKAYTVKHLATMERNEVIFALQNAKQQFYDAIDSLDVYNDKQRELEERDDDENYPLA